MRIFIAGATGTLGFPLVEALVAQGHEVTGLTRSAEKKPMLAQVGAEAAVADALDSAGLERAVRDAEPDCVVHALTALPKGGPRRAADMKETNILRTTGTRNLLNAAVAAGAMRFVGESMILAYGFGDHGPRPLKETDDLRPREPRSWLQETVDALRDLENQLVSACDEGRIESIPLRYGFMYGKGCPSTQEMLRMLEWRLLPTVAGLENPISWIYLDDAVTATVAAIERGRPGRVYNVVDDEPVSMNEWIRRAADAAHTPAPLKVPAWLLRLVAPYPSMIFETRLPVDNTRARRELDWQPRYPTVGKGIVEAVSTEPV